jgi:hypothetical protein
MLTNPFRAEWLFKPCLIQATARLERQLLSEETQIIFSKEHLAGCTTRPDRQIPRRTMVDKRWARTAGEATADKIGTQTILVAYIHIDLYMSGIRLVHDPGPYRHLQVFF